jgi:dTDP-glucose pyrophosphorylase
MIDISKNTVSNAVSLRQAMEKLNKLSTNLTLFVVDESEKLVGTLTDGDIRRGLLSDLNQTQPLQLFMNTKFRWLNEGHIRESDIVEYKKLNLSLIPVLESTGRINSILELNKLKGWLPLTAIIMAGGEGQRLRPLTLDKPKPLLEVGGKPIIEHNIDRLIQYGIQEIYISIRYLGEQLMDYFGDGSAKGISIKYITEDSPLGTIGAVEKVSSTINKQYLVMNSDLLTTIDFDDFYQHYKTTNSSLCVATVPYEVKIPYAIIETDQENVLSFQEKPTYTYYSNAGMYIFSEEVRCIVPQGQKYDATDLMQQLIEDKKKVGHYHLLSYWLDIGKHEDFEKAQKDIMHLSLLK